MSKIEQLTPQMAAYSEYFADEGEVRWLPYLMYFHPPGYDSEVVSTDRLGFRYSVARGRRYSVADCDGIEGVRLLAGSSTVFGIGSTQDSHTLSSQLTQLDARPEFWLNFGGRSFNSTQEMILFALHHGLLPPVKEIVLFSGFNDLGLARLPERYRGEYGGFFLCHQFYEALTPTKPTGVLTRLFGKDSAGPTEEMPSLEEQIAYAVKLTSSNLKNWVGIASMLGAEVRYVLQPLSNWLRPTGSSEEEAIFAELEERGGFEASYGDILTPEALGEYASQLSAAAGAVGVKFFNMADPLRDRTSESDWLYVDRIHFTDHGNRVAAQTLLDLLDENAQETVS